MKSMNPTSQASRSYGVWVLAAMLVYFGLLFGSVVLLQRGVTGPLRILVAVVPALPIYVIFLAVVRYLARTDELQRRIQVESLALSAGVTAVLAVTYGFLENVGLPTPSAWWTWSVLGGVWLLASLGLRLRYRG
ncbi:MAG: hypothetical protein ACYDA5_10510 [Vulcanimicrobiaceae bacterium]